MASIKPWDLLVVLSNLCLGSAIVTYLLRRAKFNLKPLHATKPGKAEAPRKAENPSKAEAIHKATEISGSGPKSFERVLNLVAVSDPLTVPSSSITRYSRGYLETLPQRRGGRPQVDGISTPIQKTQLPPWEMQHVNHRLRQLIVDISEKYPLSTYLGRSTFEPGCHTSLYARHRAFNETKYYGEIVSANTKDGFIHASLHPSDVKLLIEKGWAQRHPLSGRFVARLAGLLDRDQPTSVEGSRVLIYAPRNDEDLEVVEHIIKASVWWVGGIGHRHDDEMAFETIAAY